MPAAPVKFAYWVPNVSGGLVTSKIEQRTDWGYEYNRELAVLAENNGFDYALSQVRYMASYGAEYQHDLVFTGRKSFSTGGKVSDVTVLEGVLEGTDHHVFAIVPSDSAGLTFHDDWDNIGQRLTESGGVTLDGVRTPWSSAAGYVDKEFRPRTYNTLNVPTIQLVFVNFYLGIAAGALETAATYTRTKSRSWLHGGHERAVDEPYVIDVYGDLTAKLWAVEALADTVAAEGQKLHDDPDAVTEQARGDFEVRVAAVKARATDVALEISRRIFEVTGARSTATSEGLDRFWRMSAPAHPSPDHRPPNEALRAVPPGLHDPVA